MLNFDSLIGKSPSEVDEYIRSTYHVNHSDIKSAVQVFEKDKRIQSEHTNSIYLNGFNNHLSYTIDHEGKELNLNFYFNIVFRGKKKSLWEIMHENVDIRGWVWEHSLDFPYTLKLERYTVS